MKQIKTLVLLLICVAPFFSLTARAGDDHEHENNGNHYGQGGCPKDGNRAPIDGGITILLAAGAAFGIKKAWNKNKKDVPYS